MTDQEQERAFKEFEAAVDTIATTPLPAGMSGSRDHLIAAAKAYVNVRERMTGPIGVDGDGNPLVVTIEEARRMKREGPKIIDATERSDEALQRRSWRFRHRAPFCAALSGELSSSQL